MGRPGDRTTESSLARQLTWRRHKTGWGLFVGRRRFGDVVPDSKYPSMWRSLKSNGRMSDIANLSWAKNSVLEEAIRELEWVARQRRAITPSKSQQIAPVFESKSPPMLFSVSGVST
jgi:hypothetical protein